MPSGPSKDYVYPCFVFICFLLLFFKVTMLCILGVVGALVLCVVCFCCCFVFFFWRSQTFCFFCIFADSVRVHSDFFVRAFELLLY